MCGGCFSKPCTKVYVWANGDRFNVSDDGLIIEAGRGPYKYYNVYGPDNVFGPKFYKGDVELEHYIPGVFLQFKSYHKIDELIISWYESIKLQIDNLNVFVREQLSNPHIPAQTINNRLGRLRKQGYKLY